MTTTEQKIKLNLRPSIGVNDKIQQQPTKLLINHGKPNFTINRTTNTKKYLNGVKSEQDENGFTKIILKKASDNNNSTSKIINNGNGNGGIQIKLQSKKSTTNNPEVNNEFLQKRKQIYEKIEKENSLDENGYMNKVENLSNTMSTTTPIEQQSYVKNISRQLENVAVLSQTTAAATTTTTTAAAVTGVHTSSSLPPPPAIPPAPPMPNHNKFPIQQNGNGITVIEKQITYKNKDTKDYHTSANKISINSSPSNGNANFEQKTFVSFSKDLASEPNKYPDTIKIVKTVSPTSTTTATAATTILNGIENNVDPVVLARRNEVLQELTKLKFDIEVKDDVIIRPVIRDS